MEPAAQTSIAFKRIGRPELYFNSVKSSFISITGDISGWCPTKRPRFDVFEVKFA
ncbi:unnamed protein product [Schistosoma mattheei]|uniref:Uncharacterized protein n=1 Tax=Schistosoma mattheei TaxID=31246 RepID=A0A3P8G6V2_9TREM|nr:unnamed protein product [Schistosoma mattheei]